MGGDIVGILVNGGDFSSFIALPVEIVDKYIATASGVYIKVLLAVIRNNNIDTKKLSDLLSIPQSDVSEAIGYWKSVNILTEDVKSEKKACATAVTPNDISAERVSEQMQVNPQIKFLLCTAECLYARPLTSTEQKGLVYINEVMGLPADVIIMAVEYCISIGKTHFNYIQKLCAGWADDEINTHTRAEDAIKKLNEYRSREGQVRVAFGIEERAMTANNKKYINGWFDDGFGIDMIKIAYERTVDNIGKLSFPYINRILQSWKENGILHPDDLNTKEPSRSKPKTSKITTSYDLEEFEKMGFRVPK